MEIKTVMGALTHYIICMNYTIVKDDRSDGKKVESAILVVILRHGPRLESPVNGR